MRVKAVVGPGFKGSSGGCAWRMMVVLFELAPAYRRIPRNVHEQRNTTRMTAYTRSS
mgnify:CR=1 FL=1